MSKPSFTDDELIAFLASFSAGHRQMAAARRLQELIEEVRRLTTEHSERDKIAAVRERSLREIKAERDVLLRSFTEACDEAGCAHDNEALLVRISELKDDLARRHKDACDRFLRIKELERVLAEINGCFQAAFAEGWIDAVMGDDTERVRDLWQRRISFAQRDAEAAVCSFASRAEPEQVDAERDALAARVAALEAVVEFVRDELAPAKQMGCLSESGRRIVERVDAALAGQPTRSADDPVEVRDALCEDCLPDKYPTDKTRCEQCPRRGHGTKCGMGAMAHSLRTGV